uniref:C2H2-type domain-containing protein n=1 Tax=Monodon monoceros TaxID=40151 RepID=A0A8C6AIN7_MONMO
GESRGGLLLLLLVYLPEPPPGETGRPAAGSREVWRSEAESGEGEPRSARTGGDPNCELEDKTEDGEAGDCKKRPEDGEELEDEGVHSCDSCFQVFESLSDITEHKINRCQLTGIKW